MSDETLKTLLDYGLWLAVTVGLSVLLLVGLLLCVAFLLLMDRKVWAAVQLRKGPNVVGPFGLLQSFADLLKFVIKEPIIPAGADKGVFLLAPLATATFALASWAVIPVNENSWGQWVIADLNVGILYLLAISSLGVYGVIMGGWASNSKYPFMGALRSAAQMISYEVSLGFVIITVLLLVGSLNLTAIVNAQSTGVGTSWGFPPRSSTGIGAALPDVRHLLHLGACRNEPPALRSRRSRKRARRGLHGRVRLHALPSLHAREYVAITTMCAMSAILFMGGWLPRSTSGPEPRPRHLLVHDQDRLHVLHVRDGEGDRPPLPV